ncbi:T9SS type A sorting domain-containing protein [Flavobacterium sp. 3HN19-14]|uniref:T9SS type A sorting domain-containing protein n=1 Tax=Flavobacterium sp. 3HN19-14 TaxID=3448133 RepID=UPI003EDF59DE
MPLSFSTAAAGNYTIAIDHTDGLFMGDQIIYIKDNLLGLTHNLKESAYTFTSAAGDFAERFEIVFTPFLGTDVPQISDNNVIVYEHDGAIYVVSPSAEIQNITLYDIRGRKLYEQKDIKAFNTTLSNLNIAEGVQIITIETDRGKVSKKIVY